MTELSNKTSTGITIVIIGGVAGAAAGLAGFGGLNFSADYAGAEKACLQFAEETHLNPAWTPSVKDKKIFVVDRWTKSGNVVIQLGQKVNDGNYFQSRLCVVGGGYVRIPGVFQEWQYSR